MAMNTLGDKGAAAAITITADAVDLETIFTTPATADYQWTYEIHLWGGENLISYPARGTPSGGYPSVIMQDLVNGPMVSIRGIAGPNTAIQIPFRNHHPTVTKDINVSWNYLGQKIT